MKAAVLHQFGMPLTIQDISTPIPADDEVLVQTMACGIDGTDLKLLDGFGYTPELPFIMGHEIAGVVSETGKGVTDFKAGDRVVVYNFLICGKCLYCLTHREQLCIGMRGVMGVLNASGAISGQQETIKTSQRSALSAQPEETSETSQRSALSGQPEETRESSQRSALSGQPEETRSRL